MKTINAFRFALLTAALLPTHTTFAAKAPPPPPPAPSSGTVVFDYLHPGGIFAENFGLTVAPSGAVYACGTADVNNNTQWNQIVLGSGNNGANWVGPLDDFGAPGFYTS